MTIQHLPRPWLLAALADVPVNILAQHAANVAEAERGEHGLPRHEPRRRRLSVQQRTAQWPYEMYGEDYWQGAEQWHDLEGERAKRMSAAS